MITMASHLKISNFKLAILDILCNFRQPKIVIVVTYSRNHKFLFGSVYFFRSNVVHGSVAFLCG